MNEDAVPLEQTRKPRVSRVSILLIVAAFLAGLWGGVAVDHYLWRGRPGGPLGGMGPDRGHGPEAPEQRAAMQRRMADRLTRELKLTPEQRQRVEVMLPRHMAAFDSLRREMAPRLQALLDSSSAEMEAILTPEQRVKWEENRRRFGPRHGPPMP